MASWMITFGGVVLVMIFGDGFATIATLEHPELEIQFVGCFSMIYPCRRNLMLTVTNDIASLFWSSAKYR